jgi:hypothetical protein
MMMVIFGCVAGTLCLWEEVNRVPATQPNITIIIGAVVGGAALILCILSACYYFRRWQSEHPADNAQHVSNTAGHEDLQLTPFQQPQLERRPPELNPFCGLTVGEVYSE